jgi:hypothetical protein
MGKGKSSMTLRAGGLATILEGQDRGGTGLGTTLKGQEGGGTNTSTDLADLPAEVVDFLTFVVVVLALRQEGPL